jgi:hypothetical protein
VDERTVRGAGEWDKEKADISIVPADGRLVFCALDFPGSEMLTG